MNTEKDFIDDVFFWIACVGAGMMICIISY